MERQMTDGEREGYISIGSLSAQTSFPALSSPSFSTAYRPLQVENLPSVSVLHPSRFYTPFGTTGARSRRLYGHLAGGKATGPVVSCAFLPADDVVVQALTTVGERAPTRGGVAWKRKGEGKRAAEARATVRAAANVAGLEDRTSIYNSAITTCGTIIARMGLVAAGTRVSFVDLHQKEVVAHFSAIKDYARCVASRSDGKLFAVADATGSVHIVQTETRQLLRQFKGHKGSARSCCFAADKTRVFSAGDDTTVRWWELSTGECLRVLTGHTDAVRCVDAPWGGAFSVAEDTYSLSQDRQKGEGGGGGTARAATINSRCISPSSLAATLTGAACCFTGSYDCTARLWDLRADDEGSCVLKHERPVEYVRFVNCVASAPLLLSCAGSEVRLWDMRQTGRSVCSISSHVKTVTAAHVLPGAFATAVTLRAFSASASASPSPPSSASSFFHNSNSSSNSSGSSSNVVVVATRQGGDGRDSSNNNNNGGGETRETAEDEVIKGSSNTEKEKNGVEEKEDDEEETDDMDEEEEDKEGESEDDDDEEEEEEEEYEEEEMEGGGGADNDRRRVCRERGAIGLRDELVVASASLDGTLKLTSLRTLQVRHTLTFGGEVLSLDFAMAACPTSTRQKKKNGRKRVAAAFLVGCADESWVVLQRTRRRSSNSNTFLSALAGGRGASTAAGDDTLTSYANTTSILQKASYAQNNKQEDHTDTKGERRTTTTETTERKGLALIASARRRRKLLLRMRANHAHYFTRGRSALPLPDDLVVNNTLGRRHGRLDRLLRSFQYQAALDISIATSPPQVVVALVAELLQRGGLEVAVRGRDAESVRPILEYISRNITMKGGFSTRIVSELAMALLQECGEWMVAAGSDAYILELLKRIAQKIAFELDQIRQMDRLHCLLDSLLAI